MSPFNDPNAPNAIFERAMIFYFIFPAFSLYGEYVVHVLVFFLPCDHAGFLTSAYVRIQSIKKKHGAVLFSRESLVSPRERKNTVKKKYERS